MNSNITLIMNQKQTFRQFGLNYEYDNMTSITMKTILCLRTTAN